MRRICSFAGHGNLNYSDEIKIKIFNKCDELISMHKVKEFWVGNYGGFDKISAIIVRELKKKYPDIKLILVIPYVTAEINQYKEIYYKEYDEIIISEYPENTPQRLRILKCNQYMIDKSSFLIAYVSRSCGGAAKTLEYAKRKKNIEIFNFGI